MIIVLIFTLLTSPLTDYVTGTVLKAFEELWRKTGDKRYSQYIQKTVDNVVNSDGTITDSKLSDYNVEKKEQDWADPATGLSAIFWGRAMGWYALALVDVLDYLQPEHSGRNDLIAILKHLAEAISKVQDDSTGMWWQVLDQPYREGNYLEASVSCMFVYALAKRIRLGYLMQSSRLLSKRHTREFSKNLSLKMQTEPST